jgi:molybdopterin-binding protein
MLSARNQFQGTVHAIKLGTVMAEVTVKVGDLTFVSVITRVSAETLGLEEGSHVRVVVKATGVMLAND